MGLACKIKRDVLGNITRVESPNGGDSKLYEEALKLTKNPEEAGKIWAYAYNDVFKSTFGDWQNGENTKSLEEGEPKLNDVLKSIFQDGGTKPYTAKELRDINRLSNDKGKTLDETLKSLDTYLLDKRYGLRFDKDSLKKTGLFSDFEISNLLSSSYYKDKIVKSISKLRNHLRNVIDKPKKWLNDFIGKHPLEMQNGKYSTAGQANIVSIGEIENYLVKELGDYTNEGEFLQKLSNLSRQDLAEEFMSDPEAISYIRDLIKRKKSVSVKNVVDGDVVPTFEGDRYEVLLNTLEIDSLKTDYTSEIEDLRNRFNEDWVNNEEVDSILDDVIDSARDNGIDLGGLRGMVGIKSNEEIIGLLEALTDFDKLAENGNMNKRDVRELADILNEFFDDVNLERYDVVERNPNYEKLNLVKLRGEHISERDLFEKGYVNISDNLYHEMETSFDYDSLVEDVYNELQEDVSILPKQAFNLFGLDKNGDYDIDAITNLENKQKVLNSISKFVAEKSRDYVKLGNESYDEIRAITLTKAFMNPNGVSPKVSEMSYGEVKNFDYITSDFISDFYSATLDPDNKILYDSFYIDSNGIQMKPLTLKESTEVALFLDEIPELRDNFTEYLKVSKNESLATMRDLLLEKSDSTVESRRDMVFNHPESLKKFKGDFTKVGENTMITTETQKEFVRLDDGVYERVSYENGISQYGKLLGVTNKDYYLPNSSEPFFDLDVDLSKYNLDGDLGHQKTNELNGLDDVLNNFTC